MVTSDCNEMIVILNNCWPNSEHNEQQLFMVHSILGDPLQEFTTFVDAFGDDFQLWGLRSKLVFDPTYVLDDFQQMASDYINAIKTIQPNGPYNIAGLSVGGTIFWEMARQLENNNDTVNLPIVG